MKTLTKILAVDDDEDVIKVIQYCFASVPEIELKTALSGEEALKMALAIEPDIILLDAMMPKMDGLATLKALKLIPNLTKIPVIFLTAKTQKMEIEEYKRAGASDVIIKPFDPLTLPQKVIDIWKRCCTP